LLAVVALVFTIKQPPAVLRVQPAQAQRVAVVVAVALMEPTVVLERLLHQPPLVELVGLTVVVSAVAPLDRALAVTLTAVVVTLTQTA
jgi:hypothetical protein